MECARFQPTIEHSGSRLKHTLRGARRPAHLLQLVHARIYVQRDTRKTLDKRKLIKRFLLADFEDNHNRTLHLFSAFH